MTLRYRIRIGAPLPEGVTTEIERRFGPVGTLTNRNRRPVCADSSRISRRCVDCSHSCGTSTPR